MIFCEICKKITDFYIFPVFRHSARVPHLGRSKYIYILAGTRNNVAVIISFYAVIISFYAFSIRAVSLHYQYTQKTTATG